MNKNKEIRMHRQVFKDKLFKLIDMVGKSGKYSSLKVFPGETILITLYINNSHPGANMSEIAAGQFPMDEAIRFMESEINDGKQRVS